jgi:hypothetical protein
MNNFQKSLTAFTIIIIVMILGIASLFVWYSVNHRPMLKPISSSIPTVTDAFLEYNGSWIIYQKTYGWYPPSNETVVYYAASPNRTILSPEFKTLNEVLVWTESQITTLTVIGEK